MLFGIDSLRVNWEYLKSGLRIFEEVNVRKFAEEKFTKKSGKERVLFAYMVDLRDSDTA